MTHYYIGSAILGIHDNNIYKLNEASFLMSIRCTKYMVTGKQR